MITCNCGAETPAYNVDKLNTSMCNVCYATAKADDRLAKYTSMNDFHRRMAAVALSGDKRLRLPVPLDLQMMRELHARFAEDTLYELRKAQQQAD